MCLYVWFLEQTAKLGFEFCTIFPLSCWVETAGVGDSPLELQIFVWPGEHQSPAYMGGMQSASPVMQYEVISYDWIIVYCTTSCSLIGLFLSIENYPRKILSLLKMY